MPLMPGQHVVCSSFVSIEAWAERLFVSCQCLQVGQMKREYDKLQRRYLKHNCDKHRDSADESEFKQLSLKLEVMFVNYSTLWLSIWSGQEAVCYVNLLWLDCILSSLILLLIYGNLWQLLIHYFEFENHFFIWGTNQTHDKCCCKQYFLVHSFFKFALFVCVHC